jgi:hypothetical protein
VREIYIEDSAEFITVAVRIEDRFGLKVVVVAMHIDDVLLVWVIDYLLSWKI